VSERDAGLLEGAVAELHSAVDRLNASGAPSEALATVHTPRRLLFVQREPRLLPSGRVWHLGVFLLAPDATLYEVGTTTRAVEPGRPNYQSISGENRRAQRAAALRGGFAPGEVVNFDAKPIILDIEALRSSSGRLFVSDGRLLVRWRAGADAASAREFSDYLRERLELLIGQ
jgi:hypothetical protein